MGRPQGPAPLKLSKARRRALDALALRHAKGRCGRVSNVTDVKLGLVYWDCAQWLIANGLAEPIGENGHVYIRITGAGLQLVEGGR